MNWDVSGTIVAVTVIVGALVEITPIKISPLAWIGDRVNHRMYVKVDKINHDLQEHIADDMRSYILSFQKQCLNHETHTQEDFHRAYNMCDKYEAYIRDNKLKNSEADEAIMYIRKTYRTLLEKGEFLPRD